MSMLPKPKVTPPPSKQTPVPAAPQPVAEPEDGEGARMGFFDHLDELRQRLFKASLALVIGTVIGVVVAEPVLKFLVQPYGQQLVFTDPTGAIVQYFRVALLVGAILSIPMITYQLLMFVLPGLTQKEKRLLLISIPPVTVLFLIGVAFAWYILIPPALDFLVGFEPEIFEAFWTADRYLGFVTSLLFWMGVAFETPLIFFVLSVLGFVTQQVLIKNWRIAIVGAAIAAAVITPTVDPVNMGLVIIPLLMLYVFSIFLVGIGQRLNRAER